MNTYIFQIWIFSLSVLYSFENKHIILVVDSETEIPVENVHVYINDVPALFSDEKGFLYVDEHFLAGSQGLLSFTCVGYRNKVIGFSELKGNNFVVMLEKESIQIEETTVYGHALKQSVRYENLSSFPGRVYSSGSVIYRDTIYVVGGAVANNWGEEFFSGDMYKYSIKDDEWIKSEHTFKRRSGHAVHVYNDKMYIIGGMTALRNRNRLLLDNVIEVFDMQTQETVLDHINPHIAFKFSSVLKDSLIIMMGGSQRILHNEEKTFTKENHLLNLKTGFWYKLGEMDEGKEVNGILAGDKIYLIGGRSFRDLDLIECYDLKTGKTTVEAKMPKSVARPALASKDHLIYIFNKGFIYVYDTISRELNAYLIDIQVEEAELHYHDGKLYILGGKNTFMKNIKVDKIDAEIEISEGSPYLFRVDIDEFNTTKSIKYPAGL